MTVEKSDNVRAVGRALEILLAFTEEDPELSAGELLKRVDLSRPTLYRLIYTLQENGFLLSVGEPQRFRLGPAVARLAHVWKSTLDLGASPSRCCAASGRPHTRRWRCSCRRGTCACAWRSCPARSR